MTIEPMLSSVLFPAFLLASLLLAVTPGPGVVYIVTRSLSQGRGAGLASVAGVALGNLLNMFAAISGLALLFALSSTVFYIVKFAGALYLLYLGIRLLRRRPGGGESRSLSPLRYTCVFWDGVIFSLFNPKTTLFFAAFLPQFMQPEYPVLGQGIFLGVIFVVIAAMTDAIYALLAGALASALSPFTAFVRGGRYLGAGVLIGLGVYTAFSDFRPDD